MTPATRDLVLASAARAAALRGADVGAAVADGSRRFRLRVVRTYVAGAAAVMLVAAAALGVGVAARGATDGGSPMTVATSTPAPRHTTTRPTLTTTRTPTTSVPPSSVPPSIPPKLEMVERSLDLVEGQTAAAHVVDRAAGNATPVPAADMVWTSADETVATVSDVGVVTGLSEGTTTVTASKGGSSATVSVSVSVPIR